MSIPTPALRPWPSSMALGFVVAAATLQLTLFATGIYLLPVIAFAACLAIANG